MDTHHILAYNTTAVTISHSIIEPYVHTTQPFNHDAFCGDIGVHIKPLPHTDIDIGAHGCILPKPGNPTDHIIMGPNFSGNIDPYININFGNF
jgi:hypothetical protein